PLRGLLLAPSGREVDGECRSSTSLRVHQHYAAMRFHRALHDGEPEPGTADTSGGEGLEQPFLKIGGDAGAVVANSQRHRVFDTGAPGQFVRPGEARPDLYRRA